MDPAFIKAVREAGEILVRDEQQAAFLRGLAEEQAELKELKEQFGTYSPE